MNVGGATRSRLSRDIAVLTPPQANSRLINALVFACPFTASFSSAFGAVSIAGQSLYPFKVVVPVLALALGRRAFDVITRPATYPFILAVLAGWGVLGLAWTPDALGGLTEVSVLAFAALAATAMAVATRTPDGVRWMLRGWAGGVALTFLVALWELVSGQHLPSDFVADFAYLSDGLLLATFGNPNNFGAFIVISLPFVAIVASESGKLFGLNQRDRVVAQALLLLAPIMLTLSGSRFALIGALIACATYLVLNRRHRSAWRLGGILVLAGTGLAVLAIATGQFIVQKLGSFSDPSSFNQNSAEIRLNLILNGISFVGRTAGVGVGPAGYEALVATGDIPFPVRHGVVNPHNFWIELLSQYGVIGGVLLGVILAGASMSFVRITRDRPYGPDRQLATVMVAGMAGYVFASMTASSYINASENWMFIASFIALAPVAVRVSRDRAAETAPARHSTQPISRGQ